MKVIVLRRTQTKTVLASYLIPDGMEFPDDKKTKLEDLGITSSVLHPVAMEFTKEWEEELDHLIRMNTPQPLTREQAEEIVSEIKDPITLTILAGGFPMVKDNK